MFSRHMSQPATPRAKPGVVVRAVQVSACRMARRPPCKPALYGAVKEILPEFEVRHASA